MEIFQPNVADTRIIALEAKIRDMEALAKGLIEETVDLKAHMISMSREADEISRRELRAPAVQETFSPALTGQSPAGSTDDRTIIHARSTPQPESPAEPAMVMIMQSDGTMKMEPRRGDSHQTSSSGGYDSTRKVNLSRATRKP